MNLIHTSLPGTCSVIGMFGDARGQHLDFMPPRFKCGWVYDLILRNGRKENILNMSNQMKQEKKHFIQIKQIFYLTL